jgi:hypothetical protein
MDEIGNSIQYYEEGREIRKRAILNGPSSIKKIIDFL